MTDDPDAEEYARDMLERERQEARRNVDAGERACEIHECPDPATHFVVYNPVGQDRRREYYCEGHAELAAEDARDDPMGDLFLGPEPL